MSSPWSTRLVVVAPEEIVLVARSKEIGTWVRDSAGDNVWQGEQVAWWRMPAYCAWPHFGGCPWPELGVRVMDQDTHGVVPWNRAEGKLRQLLDVADFEMLAAHDD